MYGAEIFLSRAMEEGALAGILAYEKVIIAWPPGVSIKSY
jgi:hypothetical protein